MLSIIRGCNVPIFNDRKDAMADNVQEWYYFRDGQQLGPVSSSRIKELAFATELSPDDLIWKEGWLEWKRADKIKKLFPPISSKNESTKFVNSHPEQIRVAVETAAHVSQKLWFLDLKFQQFATPRLIGFVFATDLASLAFIAIGVAFYAMLKKPLIEAVLISMGLAIGLVFQAICLRVFLECCLLAFRAVEHLSYLRYLEKEE